jgi:chemotaxis protein MotB
MPLKKLIKTEQPEEAPAKKEKSHDSGDHDESNWLISYADMMTLLCVFFVLMFSMAKMDEGKYETLQAEIAKKFGNDYKSPSKETALFISEVFKEQGDEQQIMIKSDPQGVMITFETMILFDSMSADIRPEGRKVLDRLLIAVKAQQQMLFKEYKVVIEGHTDSIPITSGIYPSNWELSAARATSVVRLFVDQGFKPERLTAIGYGDTRPSTAERTPAGTLDREAIMKNRRVVIRLLEPRIDAIPFPEGDKNLTPAPVPAPASTPAVSAH